MAEVDQNKKIKPNNPKTYQVRKECIKRKTMELSTLCDIPVCTIITSPQGELQTWPESLDAVKEVLAMYTQNKKPEKKAKELSSSSEEKEKDEEEQGEKDILTLVESKLDAVNKRIRFLEDKNVVGKGKRKRIE
ncbi:agamous-like MADS-box protein AGL103 [Lycium ferocissimum]|uniref:agamous-like MADS-box protein AGL103 n=1 Tax=Lycium ferocissimum TaxID=112874 RepID=UPI0028154D89|nr:agamous-like MADS-box protein AGL103 [Lycium ferocissimum]